LPNNGRYRNADPDMGLDMDPDAIAVDYLLNDLIELLRLILDDLVKIFFLITKMSGSILPQSFSSRLTQPLAQPLDTTFDSAFLPISFRLQFY